MWEGHDPQGLTGGVALAEDLGRFIDQRQTPNHGVYFCPTMNHPSMSTVCVCMWVCGCECVRGWVCVSVCVYWRGGVWVGVCVCLCETVYLLQFIYSIYILLINFRDLAARRLLVVQRRLLNCWSLFLTTICQALSSVTWLPYFQILANFFKLNKF